MIWVVNKIKEFSGRQSKTKSKIHKIIYDQLLSKLSSIGAVLPGVVLVNSLDFKKN